MKKLSKSKNPLIHNGTSQYERLLSALTPDYFKIDDRSIKDLLDATYQYASLLRYFDENNQHDGNWTSFWKVEMLTFLAHVTTIDTAAIQLGYDEIKEIFQADIQGLEGDELQQRQKEYHVALIIYLRDQAEGIEDIYKNLPDELALKGEILALIQRDTLTDTEQLSGTITTLIGFHKEAHHRLNGGQLSPELYETFFSQHWGVLDENDFFQIDPDDGYRFNDQEALDKLLKPIIQTYKKIVLRACYWFDQKINNPDLHQPHIALFLTFLRLFDHARNSLNNLTRRHLEFYYEQVLCIRKRAAVPDDAHLILELAKTVDSHLIEKGTQFLAGKDSNGRPLIFQTLEDWFLNRAKVAVIKTTYIDTEGILNKQNRRIVATPDVSTLYKNGEEQPNEKSSSWRPMGDNGELPDGAVGFAVASPQLILREGVRIVDVVMELNQDMTGFNNLEPEDNPDLTIPPIYRATDYFDLALSSQEEWLHLEYNSLIGFNQNENTPGFEKASFKSRFITENIDNELSHRLEIKIILEKDHSPIERLREDLNLESGFDSQWPILRAIIQKTTPDDPLQETSLSGIYNAFRKVKITKITISVDVRGIQENLIIQSDQGVFDGTQKFYPFGPIPEIGDHFYIGSTEVFQKALETLDIKLDWIAPPEDFNDHYQFYRPQEGTRNLLDPSLQVDFIDRAENENNLEKVSKFGIISNSTINGFITDVNGAFLGGVKITEVDAEGNPILDANDNPRFTISRLNGTYSLTVSNANSYLSFSQATVAEVNDSSVLDAESKLAILEPTYQDRIADSEFESIENESPYVSINQSGQIDVTLFPKKVKEVETTVFEDTVSGQIRDIYSNTPIGGVSIIVKDSNGDEILGLSIPNSGPDFSVGPSQEISQIEFSLAGYDPLVVNFEIWGQKFSKIEVKLKPIQSPFSEQFPTRANISGNISDSDLTTPTEISDISILANGIGGTTNTNGNFFLQDVPFDGTPIEIKFSNPDLFDGTRILTLDESTEIQGDSVLNGLILFPKLITPGGTMPDSPFTLQGKLVMIDQNGDESPISGANVKVENSNLSTLTTQDGTYEIPNVPSNIGTIQLSFSHGSFLDFRTAAFGLTTEVDVVINQPSISSVSQPSTGPIRGKVMTHTNQLLQGVNVLLRDGNDVIAQMTTDGAGYYIFNNVTLTPDSNLEFSFEDYQTATVPFNSISTIDAILISQQIFNIIEGKITDIANTSLGGVNITLFGEEPIGEFTKILRFEDSNPDGTYQIAIPEERIGEPGKVEFSLGENYELTNVLSNTFNLFSEINIRLHNKLNIIPLITQDAEIQDEFPIFINTLNLQRDIRTQEFTKYSPTLKRGFIRLTLIKDDFLHNLYQNVLIASTIEAASSDDSLNATINGLRDEINALIQISGPNVPSNLLSELINDTEIPISLPNTPYTPATNSIRLSYTSSQIITGEDNKGIDQFYHVYPFNGYDSIALGEVEHKICIVPPYTRPSFCEPFMELAQGNLYIGVENLKPGANLSLLIQTQEGTERDPDLLPADVVWSYLTKHNSWEKFPVSNILKDTTNGLTKTGILQLATSPKMVNQTTLFDGNHYWLRAAISELIDPSTNIRKSAAGLPNIVDIRAQGIVVQFLNNGNELGHLEQPLPEGTVKQLLISRSAVKNIEQPFGSIHGRLPETGNPFYVRVSERLRHRDRALTIYDYERLILDRFSIIHRAKCLNHTKPGPMGADVELAPGFVTVAVIPDITMRDEVTVAEPRFSQGDLQDMADYLRTKTNLFVACEAEIIAPTEEEEANPSPEPCPSGSTFLWVVNPLYEEVQIELTVQFKQGQDIQTRRFDLDNALKEFLSPWRYHQDHDIHFGRDLHRSKIIQFVERLSYVEAIADLKLYHRGELVHGNQISPTTSRSILTTVFDLDDDPDTTDHLITVLSDICNGMELTKEC